MTQLTSTQSFALDLPPSCIAFCPTRPRYCIIGTYLLHATAAAAAASASAVQSEADSSSKTGVCDASDAGGGSGQGESKAGGQKRTGSLVVFRYGEDGRLSHQSTALSVPFAVLDIRWSPHTPPSQEPVLAVAGSTGRIVLYHLQTPEDSSNHDPNASERTAQLVEFRNLSITNESVLVLYLIWYPSEEDVLLATLSTGEVVICSAESGVLFSESVHELEAWCVAVLPAFSPTVSTITVANNSIQVTTEPAQDSSPNPQPIDHEFDIQILTGGDDVVLQHNTATLSRNHTSRASASSVLTRSWRDKRIHQAGVTAILPLSQNLVLTGSYDDTIRLISLPAASSSGPKRCLVLAELGLGGGVWRLGLLDESGGISSGNEDWMRKGVVVLASCMHAGARIVRLWCDESKKGDDDDDDENLGKWEFEVLARFEEHESMNYGSDVVPFSADNFGRGDESLGDTRRTVVSTSFYDRKVCLWRCEMGVAEYS